jgi:AraC-like DNA-binding protein/quercetin dioxygenase-like cupin family protein
MSQNRRVAADESALVVRAGTADLAPGNVTPEVASGWHQLIHAAAGALMVATAGGSWVVPSGWGVWVPAGMHHRIRAAGKARYRTVQIAPGVAPDLPAACAALAVSPLLRELILRVVALGALDRRDGVHTSIAWLLIDEVRHAEVPPFGLPEPRSIATRLAVDRLFSGGDVLLSEVAREAGLSQRTLERRFLSETGMSLGRWRRRGAMLAAIERLAAGASVRQAGAAAGYATPSAFVAAFKAEFGETPGRYFGAD